jgi:hypothetical protein
MNDTIYVYSDGDAWKWTGNHFEKAGVFEQQKLVKALVDAGRSAFTNLNGWSSRRWLEKDGEGPTIEIGGQPITLDENRGGYSAT